MKKTNNKKLEEMLRAKLKELGVTKKEVLQNTPKRWLRFIEDYTIALRQEYSDVKDFDVQTGNYNQMVIIKTHFMSICEHHLLPFVGVVWVGYLPRSSVTGASKIVKMVHHLTKKPSIQEELTQQIAEEVKKMVPDVLGVIVVVRAFHTCIARHQEGWMTTSSLHGAFKHNVFAKQEFFDLIQKDEKEIV